MAKYLVLPKIGLNMEEGTIVEWLIKPGDKVEKEQLVLRAETDKAVQDIYATDSGIVHALLAQEGQCVPCQAPIALLLAEGEGPPQAGAAEPRAAEAPPQTEGQTPAQTGPSLGQRAQAGIGRLRISPLAKKLAAQAGIDPSLLRPAQPGGRVTKADVLAYKAAPVPLPQGEEAPFEFLPFTPTRALIAQRMTASAREKPRVALTATVDCEALWAWRQRLNLKIKAGFNELIVKACAVALTRHPLLNSHSVEGGMRLYKGVHIGVAADTDRGLVVPVIRDAQAKGVTELSQELKSLAQKAREGTLEAGAMSGGTFTVTNLGMLGVERFDPIINAPQCAILGVGSMEQVPAVWEGLLCIRRRMALSLCFDHAMVDGATAAKLLREIKELLENPVDMLS